MAVLVIELARPLLVQTASKSAAVATEVVNRQLRMKNCIVDSWFLAYTEEVDVGETGGKCGEEPSLRTTPDPRNQRVQWQV